MCWRSKPSINKFDLKDVFGHSILHLLLRKFYATGLANVAVKTLDKTIKKCALLNVMKRLSP